MAKRLLKAASFVVGLLSLLPLQAQGASEKRDTLYTPEMASLHPDKGRSLGLSHFTWGAEIGSSIDLTSHDLSTFDLDVLIGYKNAYLKLLGAGVGVHRSIHTGNTFIPVYGVIRTSFTSRPSLCFMDLQAGYSFNTFSGASTFGDFTCSLGCGVNFSQSRRCKTYMIVSGGYRYFNENHKSIAKLDTRYIFVARLVFGINF